MLETLSHHLHMHDPVYLGIAAFLCVLGSMGTIRLYTRLRNETGMRKYLWSFLASIVAGTTIWSAHFVAMVGYEAQVQWTFSPGLTSLSLALAIVVSACGLSISALRNQPFAIETGGVVIGVGVALMHYTGMLAIDLPGHLEWNHKLIAGSVLAGAVLGALAMNRYGRPFTRYCEFGSVGFLSLTIVTVHAMGMEAMTIVEDPTMPAPVALVGDDILLATICAVVAGLLLITAATYGIDRLGTVSARRKYRYLALHDPITGLPNRQYLTEEFGEAFADESRAHPRTAILFISLDQFKTVNDLHGYGAGDEILSSLAANVLGILRPDEQLARFNSDEFIAIKTDVPNLNEAKLFAHRIRNIILTPIPWNNCTINMNASIGIAIFPEDSQDFDTLITRAALAAKRAKKAGGYQIKTYIDGMEEASRKHAAIAADLKNAVSDNQLQLYFQPQNDTRDGRLLGYEALLRWQHPVKGQIPADDFIPIAEQTGQILEIGQWALETACKYAVDWLEPVSVSVNASPIQFCRSDYAATVSQILIETGLPPDRLEIELTESAIIEDHERVLAAIQELKLMGVTVAMDDFGTGYSSLNTLQNFPFDKIKVDRAFTQSVESDPRSRAIIRSAVLLGHSFGIPVLAEGVENERQLDFLQEAGCAQVQGFLFGRPVPAQRIPSNPESNPFARSSRIEIDSGGPAPKRYA